MFRDNRLLHAACDYADRQYTLKEQFREKSPEYLKGRLEQHERSLAFYFFRRSSDNEEITAIRSILKGEN